MSITVSATVETKTTTGSASTVPLSSAPTVTLSSSDSSVNLKVFGTVSNLNTLRSSLNVDTKTKRGSGEPRPQADYDSIRNIWSQGNFPTDSKRYLTTLEEVGASIGDVAFATGASTTLIRQQLQLIAPPLKWRMSVRPSTLVFVGPFSTNGSVDNRSADGQTLNGCIIQYPDKTTDITYVHTIEVYDGNNGTVYATGSFNTSAPAKITPGQTDPGGGGTGTDGQSWFPSSSYKFSPLPTPEPNGVRGNLSNGSTLTVPAPYTGLDFFIEFQRFVAGPEPVTWYTEFRLTEVTPPIPGFSLPTTWTKSPNSFKVPNINSEETTYKFAARVINNGSNVYNSTLSYKVKRDVVKTATVTNQSGNTVSKLGTVSFSVTTSGFNAGETLYWILKGNVKTNDFTDNTVSGSFVVGASPFVLTKKLTSTVSSDTKFSLEVRSGSTSGALLATGSEITISPISITADRASVDEGGTVTFTVESLDLANGSKLYWTTQGSVSSSDFSDNTLSGSFEINNNLASITRTTTSDQKKEGVENFKIEIRSGSITGPVLIRSENIVINDTSLPEPPPGYTDDETYDENAPNSPLNPQYRDIRNLFKIEDPLVKINTELKSIDEKIGAGNAHMSRIADAMESISDSLKGIESHQRIIKDLAQGEGIHFVGPYEWVTLISLYKLLVEEGSVLDDTNDVPGVEQERAFAKMLTYIEILNKIPTQFKKD